MEREIALVLSLFAVLFLAYWLYIRSLLYRRPFQRQIRIDLYRWFYRMADLFYDFLYSFRTCKEVSVKNLKLSRQQKSRSNKYQATPYQILHLIFSKLRGSNYLNYTFIDIGCGKGRVSLLAKKNGFKKVVAVDISKQVLGDIYKNLKGQNGIEVRIEDAVDLKMNSNPAILFLFNPFDEFTTKKFLARVSYLQKKLKITELVILYVNPLYHSFFKYFGFSQFDSIPHYYQDFRVTFYRKKYVSPIKISEDFLPNNPN